MDISKSVRDQVKTLLSASWNAKIAEKLPDDPLAAIDFASGSSSFLLGNMGAIPARENEAVAPLLILGSTVATNEGIGGIEIKGKKKFEGDVSLTLLCIIEWPQDSALFDFEPWADACEHALSEIFYAAEWTSPVHGRPKIANWSRGQVRPEGSNWRQTITFNIRASVVC